MTWKKKLLNIQQKQMGTNCTVQCLNTLQFWIYRVSLCGGWFLGCVGAVVEKCSSPIGLFILLHLTSGHMTKHHTHYWCFLLSYVRLIVVTETNLIYFDFKIHNMVLSNGTIYWYHFLDLWNRLHCGWFNLQVINYQNPACDWISCIPHCHWFSVLFKNLF